MERVEKKLIKKAKVEYKRIFPCSHRQKLEECFTREKDLVYLWFNRKKLNGLYAGNYLY